MKRSPGGKVGMAAIARMRKLAGTIYRGFVPIVRQHRDIRAYVSIAEEEGFEHIHYGYWDEGSRDFKLAQETMYLKIRSLIPDGVSTVLDIGGGIGGVSNQLARDGYEPLCIVPDKALISVGTKRFPGVRFLKGTAEEFTVHQTYDAAVMIESYQYFSIKPRAIANTTRSLSDRGCVIFAEEFSLTSDSFPREETLISYMTSNGYSLDLRIDITRQVLPTCRYIYEKFGEKMSGLAERWRGNEELYSSGARQYLLMRFKADSSRTRPV